ncbi:MAG: sulfotransferase domain-containing protein [Sulfitobacter sp.]
MIKAPRLPTHRYEGKITDPSRWNALRPRVGDIVVSTPPKSGTTWLQGILALLISGDPNVDADVTNNAPWFDINLRELDEVIKKLDAQTQLRQIKTHTPLDGIPVWPDLRYISIYRHPIDVHFSFRKHLSNMTQDVLGDVYPDDISESFRIFLEGDHFDGASLSTIVSHYRSALQAEPMENLLRLHYADMRRDLPGGFARIARHIGIRHDDTLLKALIDAASFTNMKANADRFAVAAGNGFWRKDADFFDSATSNKWVGILSKADLAAYDARMSELLDPEERRWLEWGTPS